MRKIKLTVLALALIAGFFTLASCNKTDDTDTTQKALKDAEIPTEIKSYVAFNFASNTITEAYQNTNPMGISFEIHLSGNTELEFNSLYEITEINGVAELPVTVIPQAILDYVAQNYPNNFITDWELEDMHQEVELNNELELEFTLDGVFIRVDIDDNDDETILTEAETPVEIISYIQTHFASSTIIFAIKETDDSVLTYEIILSENVTLEFNSLYQIMDIDGNAQLPATVIPQAILDYVSQNYPNNFITDWELEDMHQEVELNNEMELEFTLDGVFIRVDND
jgi:hypothetical protein